MAILASPRFTVSIASDLSSCEITAGGRNQGAGVSARPICQPANKEAHLWREIYEALLRLQNRWDPFYEPPCIIRELRCSACEIRRWIRLSFFHSFTIDIIFTTARKCRSTPKQCKTFTTSMASSESGPWWRFYGTFILTSGTGRPAVWGNS